ncbi:Chemoreceptor glutamine deamidase CheD [bioreactor metagenome]|uniref:Chemoreceptor glutamine deamidase CheD n=1 Tax=bioreactor metagenome TaxID=1076179 RepID=A0A644ZSM2_9ZZZZ
MTKISVDIAVMKIARAPDQLYCLGLGSCVGVAVYDPVLHLAGMIHVLLPSMLEFESAGQIRTKFADTGISDMVDALLKAGALKHRLRAKMAGGAAMFAVRDAADDTIAIGKRNIASCRDTLKRLGIELVAQDTGGTKGRTITFDIASGALSIRMLDKGEKVI